MIFNEAIKAISIVKVSSINDGRTVIHMELKTKQTNKNPSVIKMGKAPGH